MHRTRRVVPIAVVLAAIALIGPSRSAPAQSVYHPDDGEWEPVTELAKWESPTGGVLCTGMCPGEDAACCSSAVAPI